MDPKAKGEFLKKISINGFSITEKDNTLTLRPWGAEATAGVTIEEVQPNVWKVVSGSGQFTAFARGKKRSYFESHITRWAMEAVLQTEGQPAAPPGAPE